MLVSWQALGNLNNGANAGLWYVNGNNTLTNTNWNIGSRQSGGNSLSTSATSTAPSPETDAAMARSTE